MLGGPFASLWGALREGGRFLALQPPALAPHVRNFLASLYFASPVAERSWDLPVMRAVAGTATTGVVSVGAAAVMSANICASMGLRFCCFGGSDHAPHATTIIASHAMSDQSVSQFYRTPTARTMGHTAPHAAVPTRIHSHEYKHTQIDTTLNTGVLRA